MKENRKYFIKTYGCQMNEHDSEVIAGILEDIGYKKADEMYDADMIIFNTCLVRENAELKVYGKLGELKALKKENEDLLIGICGCMMQRENIRNIIKKKYRFVDLIFGTHNIHQLPELIANHRKNSQLIESVWEDSKEIIEETNAHRKYDFKAFVNIMYGCNNFCSYCIVPYTRGREKSREPENIVNEIEKLANNGYKEITLLGQNVNSYGKTLDNKITFADLLRKINEIKGIERIRFMTSHPKDLSDDLIYAMRDCNKICEHLHLPFQAGSNKVLKAMNRKYTKEKYLNVIEKVKSEIPNIAITTDIIVGFPGETEEDFNETLDIVEKVKFDNAFTFLYSVREGTPAANMKNQIPDKIKHNRFNKLQDILYPISYNKNKLYKDKIVEVLVEEISKNNKAILSGRTSTNKLVHFEGDNSLIGKFVNVKITNPKTWTLEGEIVKENTLM